MGNAPPPSFVRVCVDQNQWFSVGSLDSLTTSPRKNNVYYPVTSVIFKFKTGLCPVSGYYIGSKSKVLLQSVLCRQNKVFSSIWG